MSGGAMEPIRPIFWNIHENHPWAEVSQYVLGSLAALLFLWGVYRHFARWRSGRPEQVLPAWPARVRAFVQFALLQGRLASDRYALAMHLAIFLGMAALFIGTALNWRLVAARLRVYTQKTHSLTLASFFEERFKDPSGLLRMITALITLIFFTIYASSGLVASGKLFESMFHIDYAAAVVLGGRMIVWGGAKWDVATAQWVDLSTGGRYDFATDQWSA